MAQQTLDNGATLLEQRTKINDNANDAQSRLDALESGKGFMLQFANNTIQSTTVDRWLLPNNSSRYSGATTTIVEGVMDLDCDVHSMTVLHGDPAGNGEDVVYTLQKNGVDESLSVTIASTGTIESSAILSTPISYNRGDTYSLKVTKALSIGASPNLIEVTAKCTERIV